jgi:ABC-type nitrate/sulfonate/bicarbonate transport system substrate-binding protein
VNAAAALLTVAVSARSVGLSASAQIPEKIVMGTIPINPVIASYISQLDFFKEEGLTVETTRFNNFAPIL